MSISNNNLTQKFNLAHSLYCKKMYSDAFNAYIQLAEQEYSNCQMLVGWMYFCGKGIEKNLTQAEYWLLKSSEGNDVEAQLYLGKLYTKKRDYALAFKWYEAASKNKNFPATYKLGIMYDEGKGVFRNEDHAIELYRSAAISGYVYSKKAYSLKLLKGKRGVLNIVKGLFIYIGAGISCFRIANIDIDNERLRI